MRFTFNDTEFLIEFERIKKVPAQSMAGVARAFTTAKLFRLTPETKIKIPVREYTVGCNYRDQFTYEGGRKAALTMALYDAATKSGGYPLMGTPLTKEFRTAVWKAYHGRPRPISKPKDEDVPQDQVQAVPVA